MGAHQTATIAPILAILYSLGFTNLFLRSSFGVMAPDLAREMALEPAALSTVASAFFFTYAAMQVPTGILLDRFGPRRTLAAMLVFATVGAGIFTAGGSAAALTGGRLLMGFGFAGTFTGAFYILNQWMRPDRVVSQIGALNSFAAIGSLAATAPLAILIAWIGWRESYWLFTACIGGLTVALALLVRDAPPGHLPPSSKHETLRQAFAGVADALAQPGMKRLLVAGLPLSFASTMSGVWGAPYLQHVHGLGAIGRGNVLLGMAACTIAGHFLYGQLARRLNTLKGMVLTGSSVVLLGTSALAALEQPPLGLVVGLFCLIALFSAYPTITHAHARGLVPNHLVGRGVSVTNMGVMTAIAVMQLAFGWIVGAFPQAMGAPPEHAYRAAFAVHAAAALLAIAVYAPIRDVRPRG